MFNFVLELLIKNIYLSPLPISFLGESTYSCSSEPLENFLRPAIEEWDGSKPSSVPASRSTALVDDCCGFCCSKSEGTESLEVGLVAAISSSLTSKQPLYWTKGSWTPQARIDCQYLRPKQINMRRWMFWVGNKLVWAHRCHTNKIRQFKDPTRKPSDASH